MTWNRGAWVLPGIAGRVALVTGASGAIGGAIARALGEQGARVALHCHQNAAAADASVRDICQAGGEAAPFQADLTVSGAIPLFVARVEEHWSQPIGILVNNAGLYHPNDALATLTEPVYHQLMDVNFKAAVFLSQAVVPRMSDEGRGAIVNVASDAGFTGGAHGVAIYSAAKAALLNFTKNLAKEVAGTGIRVNAVAPGPIAGTPADAGKPQEVRRMLIDHTPVRREGRPDDVAQGVLFLASDLASFVTGEALVVSGGLHMR